MHRAQIKSHDTGGIKDSVRISCLAASCIFFVTLAGCAGISSKSDRWGDPSFYSIYGQTYFDAREKPAVRTTLSEKELNAKGYVQIGHIHAARKVKICTGVNCRPADPDTDPTQKILVDAAKYGGDLVKLIKNNVSMIDERDATKCLKSETGYTPDYRTGSSTYGSYVHSSSCAKYVRAHVKTHGKKSTGTVWRFEPNHMGSAKGLSSRLGWAAVDDHGWKFIDRTGKVVLKINKYYDWVMPFSEGLAAAGGYGSSKFGYIDRTGQEVIPQRYDSVQPFSEGVAVVSRNGRCSYIDKTGKYVMKASCKVSGFSEGLAAQAQIVGGKEKWGYINHKGKFVIKPTFKHTYRFSEGLALVEYGGSDGNSLYGYIDKSGKLVIRGKNWKYPSLAPGFHEGLAMVTVDGKNGYIDKTGEFVIPPQWEYAKAFTEGLAAVGNGSKSGYIDRNGNFVISPRFAATFDFFGGIAAVRVDCRKSSYGSLCPLGYINRKGKFILKPIYGKATGFTSRSDLKSRNH